MNKSIAKFISWLYMGSVPVGTIGALIVAIPLGHTDTVPTSGQSIWLFCMIGLLLTTLVICFIQRWLPRWFACDQMGWHLTPNSQSFSGCGMNGTCPRCHEEVSQDSQGNWF